MFEILKELINYYIKTGRGKVVIRKVRIQKPKITAENNFKGLNTSSTGWIFGE